MATAKCSTLVPDQLRRRYRLGRDRLRTLKRQILRFPRAPRLAIEYRAYRGAIRARDWTRARDAALRLSNLALQHNDRRMIQEMMHALERLHCFEESARMRLAWKRLLPGRVFDEWWGENLAGRTLLIDFTDRYEGGVGLSYRGANLVAKAANRAGHVIVAVEPRLVATYRRSFPALDIVETAAAVEDGRVDFFATLGNLIGAFAPKDNIADPEFYPLVPDPALVSTLRSRYQDGHGKPAIGAFWYSSHHGKELPGLPDWRAFMDNTDAQFVSLQYGEVEDDIAFLGRDRVIHDTDIDQLVNLDDFAAQVAALDAVVAISGTPAHVAGAVGVPTVLLRDDWFRRAWPVMGDRVPWYPYVRVVGKDGRPWAEVFEDASATLRLILAEGGREP